MSEDMVQKKEWYIRRAWAEYLGVPVEDVPQGIVNSALKRLETTHANIEMIALELAIEDVG